MAYFGQVRSPKTKREVKEASNVLFILGILFSVGTLFGVGAWFSSRDTDWLILAVVLGLITPLLLAAGVYNIYYIRRMEHHPLMAKALHNPSLTVLVIFVLLSLVYSGAVALIIYLK